jgi:hypothetical protein
LRYSTIRDDHVLRLDRAFAVGLGDLDLVRSPRARAREQLRGACDRIDLVLLEQEADALRDLVGDIARAFDHRGEVHADVVDEDAELFRAMRVLEHFGGLE